MQSSKHNSIIIRSEQSLRVKLISSSVQSQCKFFNFNFVA